jgi:hypothetical protein
VKIQCAKFVVTYDVSFDDAIRFLVSQTPEGIFEGKEFSAFSEPLASL